MIQIDEADLREDYRYVNRSGVPISTGRETILEFVGSNAQTIEVNETPEAILAIRLGLEGGSGS